MSKDFSPEILESQRFSGTVIIGGALFIVGLYGIFLVGSSFLMFPLEKALKKALFFCVSSLVLMSPALAAAVWQYTVRPCWVSSVVRWLGYLWLPILAIFGMQLVVFYTLLA